MDGCGELLVTHEDGRVACLDAACELPDRVFHDFRVMCCALDEPCVECTPAVQGDCQWRAA